VLELLSVLKAALFMAVLSYGASALLVRFLDDVLSRFELSPLLGRAPGSGWPGWNGLLFASSLAAGILAGVRQRLFRAKESRLVSTVLPVILLAAIPLIMLVVLELGFIWRAGASPSSGLAAAASAATPPPSRAPSAQATPTASAPLAAQPTLAPALDEPVREAPDDELARAIQNGVNGLLPLAERYPRDPAVLKPLVFAFASRATGLADAVSVAGRLFAAAPAETNDPDLRYLVKKAAASPGEASNLAFELMAGHMGNTGPDLLYELFTNSPKASKRAEELLRSDAVQKRMSPALAVAYELRAAGSCPARVPLLERASALGDERSIAILAPLSVGAKRGCGRRKRSPCPAPCASEATRYSEAVAHISSRLATTRAE
jgi:hypothetical protein